jgi:hypothetical protein
VPHQQESSGLTDRGFRRGWVKAVFTSWAVWIGLALLIPICLYVPWRQQLPYRVGDEVIQVEATRYRFLWDRPLDASLAAGRLGFKIFFLAFVVFAAYRVERYYRRPTWTPPGKEERYSDADWAAEIAERDGMSGPRPCPSCERIGFCGPREDPDGLHYRLCKFCGFYQEVGGASIELRPCVHPCDQVPQVAGAPVITWIRPNETLYVCESCGQETDLAESLISSPALDPNHPWWGVPQDLSRQEYVRFWLNTGAPGRLYL